MPIYEYQCAKCDKIFEELVFGNAAVSCPHCGDENAQKLMSRSRHKSGRGRSDFGDYTPSAPSMSSGGGCAGCAGGNCSTCG